MGHTNKQIFCQTFSAQTSRGASLQCAQISEFCRPLTPVPINNDRSLTAGVGSLINGKNFMQKLMILPFSRVEFFYQPPSGAAKKGIYAVEVPSIMN